jgi:hypothetical protein
LLIAGALLPVINPLGDAPIFFENEPMKIDHFTPLLVNK